jgi:hypothetical protein
MEDAQARLLARKEFDLEMKTENPENSSARGSSRSLTES